MQRSIGAILALVMSWCALAQDLDNAEPKPPRFVEPADAAAYLEDHTERSVLDVRPLTDYLAGHIDGAVHLDDETLRAPRAGSPVRLLEPERLAEIFAAAVVRHDWPVFVYSDRDDPLSATLVAYALGRVGHSDVRIVSGGYDAWAANHPVTRELPGLFQDELEIREPTVGLAHYIEFAPSIGFDDVVFVDARPREHYLGERATWIRNGHIPGAVSVPWRSLTQAHNAHRLKPKDEIKRILTDAGVSAADDIVVYCGTGREATLLMLTLAGELEWPKVRLYEGSWTEYSSITDTKVEVGDRVPPLTRVYQDGRFRISGQPDERTLESLAEQGVRTVISCRSDREMDRLDFDQSDTLDELGVRYVHVPMGGDHGYEPAQVAAFSDVLAETQGDVLVHCASGGRARYLWMAYLVSREGLTPSEAWARSERMGGRAWAFEALLGEPIMR